MVFNSFSYLVFFIVTASLYFIIPHKFRWIVILLGSYFFYMSWKPIYGLLLLATTFLDWILALIMKRFQEKATKKLILIISILSNLSILFFFKYFDFFSTSLWSIFKFSNEPLILQLILPIGISFYTFQSLAYIIDVYRGELPAEKNFFRYAAFVSFFPHLVSGPILRPANIIPQLHAKKEWNLENWKMGLFLIGTGLIKKIVIADRLGFFVNSIYLHPQSFSGITLLVATYLFAFQIYCDFSGYTDIAIGSARILGYTIPENFRQPYLSLSISEFWKRWHISLSSWLRDYLYIPLGGNRRGKLRTYQNLMTTMLLGGIWHGAAWTFVIWGFLHGLYLATEKFFGNVTIKFTKSIPLVLTRFFQIFLTFNLVSFAWIFFRAASLRDALYIVKTIATHFGTFQSPLVSTNKIALYIGLVFLLLIFDVFEAKKAFVKKFLELPWYYQWTLGYAVFFVLIFWGVEIGPQFIYFQF